MKKVKMFAVLISLVLFSNCSDSDSEFPRPTDPSDEEVVFGSITAIDYENLGNSGDILISYDIPKGDLSTIKELRVFVSTSAMTADDLLKLPESNSHRIEVSKSDRTLLNVNLNDTDGNRIVEGQDYTIYLLGIFTDEMLEPIVSNPISLNLSNEIVVTTPELSGMFNATEDIAIASDGTLYANEGSMGDKLYKVSPNGQSSILSSDLNGPVGIALDEEGNIYTSNFTNTTIKKITPAGQVSDIVSDSRLVGGGGIAFDNEGAIFNAFYASSTLYQVRLGAVENFATSSLFNGPVGVTYDKERGKLFVASFESGKILYVDEDGNVSEVADTPANIGHLSYADDHFYISGFFQNKIYKVSLSGEIIATIGSGIDSEIDGKMNEATFSRPNGIEATSDGRYVYVTQGSGVLRKVVMPRVE